MHACKSLKRVHRYRQPTYPYDYHKTIVNMCAISQVEEKHFLRVQNISLTSRLGEQEIACLYKKNFINEFSYHIQSVLGLEISIFFRVQSLYHPYGLQSVVSIFDFRLYFRIYVLFSTLVHVALIITSTKKTQLTRRILILSYFNPHRCFSF